MEPKMGVVEGISYLDAVNDARNCSDESTIDRRSAVDGHVLLGGRLQEQVGFCSNEECEDKVCDEEVGEYPISVIVNDATFAVKHLHRYLWSRFVLAKMPGLPNCNAKSHLPLSIVWMAVMWTLWLARNASLFSAKVSTS
ncbi:hypothetical protein VNO77_16353 [Canavalia gladiata]|uniref:Uncharacterized protein n=1 Tax=Canavalia gladiata TaxID=3824 RepID=A0AAN9M5P6_CANGL